MALKKGTLNVTWADENGVVDTPWYDTIDYEKMKTPPHLGRNAKGWRFDFASYENLHQKAMEIKEKYPQCYKNENDVYKDAHYIGMYILERALSHNKKFKPFDDMIAVTSCDEEKGMIKAFARERFGQFFEQFCTGIISEEILEEMMLKIADVIPSKKIKEWFLDDCEKRLKNENEAQKIKGKIYMRKYREKVNEAREMGIGVV